MSLPPKHNTLSASTNGVSAHSGFSLIECIIALVVLMVIALGVVFVFDFSFRNNIDSKKRFAALLLAQQRLETIRNTNFIDLADGTITENEVVSDGMKFNVVRTVTSNDLITTAAAPGPETKSITITVSPFESKLAKDAITLVTVRAGNRPGPNREPNRP
jgi:Tfp pilus assembly protein PilV